VKYPEEQTFVKTLFYYFSEAKLFVIKYYFLALFFF
jgi:hypothetical protein